jgi:hypothetical protein
VVAIAICVAVVTTILRHEINKPAKPKNGSSQVVGKVLGDATSSGSGIPIKELTYTMTLPAGWHQTNVVNSDSENSVSWQSGPADDGTRTLTVYVDRIPQNIAINRLLPILVHGQTISYGVLSGNCSTFAQASPAQATQPVPVPAKWQGISFLCNIPESDGDLVGTSELGSVDSIKVIGPQLGKNTYFFLYADHNIQPQYSVFYHILDSFKAT